MKKTFYAVGLIWGGTLSLFVAGCLLIFMGRATRETGMALIVFSGLIVLLVAVNLIRSDTLACLVEKFRRRGS